MDPRTCTFIWFIVKSLFRICNGYLATLAATYSTWARKCCGGLSRLIWLKGLMTQQKTRLQRLVGCVDFPPKMSLKHGTLHDMFNFSSPKEAWYMTRKIKIPYLYFLFWRIRVLSPKSWSLRAFHRFAEQMLQGKVKEGSTLDRQNLKWDV